MPASPSTCLTSWFAVNRLRTARPLVQTTLWHASITAYGFHGPLPVASSDLHVHIHLAPLARHRQIFAADMTRHQCLPWSHGHTDLSLHPGLPMHTVSEASASTNVQQSVSVASPLLQGTGQAAAPPHGTLGQAARSPAPSGAAPMSWRHQLFWSRELYRRTLGLLHGGTLLHKPLGCQMIGNPIKAHTLNFFL